jgi:hypothetical protein
MAHWLIPIVLLALGGAAVWLGPEEATLGPAIRVVYVHAALIWAGQVGFVGAGLLGLALMIRPRLVDGRWLHSLGWASFIMFALGVGASLVAQQMSWGAIVWWEPKTAVSLNLLAAALIVILLTDWLANNRWRGGLHLLLAGLVIASVLNTPRVLHPTDPITGSGSAGIQWTFYSLFLLAGLLTAWLAWYLQPQRDKPQINVDLH